ncbi:hypothetical protein ALI144C_27235 [Actinosynnema sp. ALI-1.44]|uniref:hypothetical protein n=1 Tax=Actinosynnema sp. ALI-1.44 TaxID=1933779 RepID=UPI00097C558A|nr:hypothetical protein [Actinosynnema sp. ALI-1.44]ONI79492.1 hypothetical protein ALI144C_27235 [Actinosynnema sp. ALI-1.44]
MRTAMAQVADSVTGPRHGIADAETAHEVAPKYEFETSLRVIVDRPGDHESPSPTSSVRT